MPDTWTFMVMHCSGSISNTEHLKRYGSSQLSDSFSSTHTRSHYVISSSLHHRLCAVLWTQWFRKRAPFLPWRNRHYILGINSVQTNSHFPHCDQNEWLAFKPVCSALCTLSFLSHILRRNDDVSALVVEVFPLDFCSFLQKDESPLFKRG